MDWIDILEREYREEDPERRHFVIFAGLNRARRLLDDDNAYGMPPKQMFMNLVKNGPTAGVNFIIWANDPNSFCSFYGELLPEFDYRLVYDLNEDEYMKIITSSNMDTNYGNNVISYNPDEDNKKVRVYSKPLQEWLDTFMDRIENKMAPMGDNAFYPVESGNGRDF